MSLKYSFNQRKITYCKALFVKFQALKYFKRPSLLLLQVQILCLYLWLTQAQYQINQLHNNLNLGIMETHAVFNGQ